MIMSVVTWRVMASSGRVMLGSRLSVGRLVEVGAGRSRRVTCDGTTR